MVMQRYAKRDYAVMEIRSQYALFVKTFVRSAVVIWSVLVGKYRIANIPMQGWIEALEWLLKAKK